MRDMVTNQANIETNGLLSLTLQPYEHRWLLLPHG